MSDEEQPSVEEEIVEENPKKEDSEVASSETSASSVSLHVLQSVKILSSRSSIGTLNLSNE